ncbi:Pentatricopeptide repeat-containing protein [Camellia lanceoleosa]|uniref:Pentatricopeptide repeat-containing protein n=1 Tax=Camellia lanceoleosa TaxID=1840588 RepID=A0ACC0FHC4_9ERIC|nr:Pentatricopeptide repeat-containing protein [Camellia lanceoleosa]
MVARKIRFSKIYGLSHSSEAFRIITHVFALAGMDREVYAFLRDIVCYYEKTNLDLFELFPALLDSPNHALRSIVVFDVLVKILDKPLEFWKKWRVGKAPTVVTYSTYIHGLCRIGFVEFALNLIQKLRRKYQPVNSYCYNAVIDGFCKRGEEDESLRVMEEMKRCGISPDVYSYSILIFGFCKNGNVEKGLCLMEKMESSNLKPSLVSYASLLKVFCNSGLMETSLDMFYKLRASGYKCDQTAYDKLINGFSMQVTCNSIVHGYCREGRVYEILQLINEMRDQGILPNRCTYNAVISRLCKEKKPEKAWELIPVMLKSNLLPEAVIYSTIIDGFDMKKAWGLFSEMLQTGHLPSVVTYTCLIDGFCKANWMDIAHLLADEMRRKKVSPDVFS